MRSLQDILRNCFTDITWSYGYRNTTEDALNSVEYMVIPLNKDILEVPVFALHALTCSSYLDTVKADTLAVKIDYMGSISVYKSLDARVRDIMSMGYGDTRLIKLDSSGSDVYYGTCGAIFDKDFNPVMLLTWEFTKETCEETDIPYKWKFSRPVLRISPEVLKKSNTVERYIVNRILGSIVNTECRIYTPYSIRNGMFINPEHSDFTAKVIIDRNPFQMKEVDRPSISTDNKDLLAIASEHIEEIVR
jgi:hypothetical protein